MAEWLGQHMQSWPVWAIWLVIALIVVGWVIYAYFDATAFEGVRRSSRPHRKHKEGKNAKG